MEGFSKTVVLITGASQDIGGGFSRWFGKNLDSDSLLILCSRSSERLVAMAGSIHQSNPALAVRLCSTWDLKQPNAQVFKQDIIEACLKEAGTSPAKFQRAIIIHNAASLGDMKTRVIDMQDVAVIQELQNINLVSMVVLNSVFLNIFDQSKRTVVNMTAGSGYGMALPSFGPVAMGKAGRHITMSILAKEEPSIKVLHFDPGAVDSSSLRQIRDTTHDPGVSAFIGSVFESGQLLTIEIVAKALGQTLLQDQFESGALLKAPDVDLS